MGTSAAHHAWGSAQATGSTELSDSEVGELVEGIGERLERLFETQAGDRHAWYDPTAEEATLALLGHGPERPGDWEGLAEDLRALERGETATQTSH